MYTYIIRETDTEGVELSAYDGNFPAFYRGEFDSLRDAQAHFKDLVWQDPNGYAEEETDTGLAVLSVAYRAYR